MNKKENANKHSKIMYPTKEEKIIIPEKEREVEYKIKKKS